VKWSRILSLGTSEPSCTNARSYPRATLGSDRLNSRTGSPNARREAEHVHRRHRDPEPKAIDETRSMELRHVAGNAMLRGRPSADQQCANCWYYLENTADVSYCWHPKLRILVGTGWWCQWWESDSEK
jgi:hypothetical protein